MKKMLFVSAHLSTGGSCQVTVNKIELLKDNYEIKLVEYSNLSPIYVVQKNRILDLIGRENLITLGDDKQQLVKVIEEFKPDVISMEEFPELFMGVDVAVKIYTPKRAYTIVETTHESSFNVNSKLFFPDKFIFVSAFSAFRLGNFDIPYEIIEYPVDHKEKNQPAAIQKLSLDSDYKHIVNVGLFTPRKNQKYVFELAAELSHHKIKFHFIGNQADNFSSYWKPLLELKANEPEKYQNCVIWGERSDTDLFLEASDLFLFTSKGEKNNKELNPIVIKEALQYDMPLLMFNLDVYCGKYDKNENVTFLTGDVKADAAKIVEITKPAERPKERTSSKELIIIGTYPNTKERHRLTVSCIKSLKKTGRKIMLLSHYPVSNDIQELVDYYIFDKENPLTHHSYYTRFYNKTAQYDVEININGLKNTNQSLTVLTNLFNGFKAAKDLGFKKALYMTYDVVLNEADLPKVESIFDNLYKYNAHLAYNETPFGFGIETTSMGFDVEFFLRSYHDVRTEADYNTVCESLKCQNFLEDYLKKATDRHLLNYVDNKPVNNLLIEDVPKRTILPNSGLGVSSNSEYYSILPIKNSKLTEFMFYFYTYNIDHRRVNVIMRQDGVEFYNNSFIISKQREFKKDFQYNGLPIEVEVIFYDGEDVYKRDCFLINNDTLPIYFNTGYFAFKKKPKIKLVQIQTTKNDEREQLSRASVLQLAEIMEVKTHVNEPYMDVPPKFNCIRPDCVSSKLFTEAEIQKYGTALTPAHYGCFEAFKNAILSEFDTDLDFLIVCEGDCIIEAPINEFIDKMYKCCEIINRSGIGYFSFGDTKTLDFGWHQSNVVEEVPDQDLLFITDKIIGLQCIMFPAAARQYLFKCLREHKWDAADIYFNTIFRVGSPFKMGILKERITTQADGISIIDNEFKTFRKK